MHPDRLAAAALLAVAALAGATSTPGEAAAGPAPSDAPRARGYVVTVAVDRTEPLVGSKVRISATVRPAAAGAKVALQVRHVGKAWRTIARGRLGRASTVTFKDAVRTVQPRWYRVVKPADRRHGAGRGTSPKVTVYGWRTLVSLPYVSSHGWMQSAVDLNAVTYSPSLVSFHDPLQPYQVDYDLARRCLLLDATYGTSDSSPNAGASSETVVGDGVQLFTGAYSFTGSQHVVTEVRGVFRLSLLGTSTNGGIAAVGRPMVLCSF